MAIFNTSLETIFSIFTKFKFDLPLKDIGYFFVYVGLAAALMQVLGISVLIRYLKDIQILLVGGFLLGLSLVLLPFSGDIVNYLFILTIFAFGIGLSHPVILGIISKLSDREDYGVVLGVTQSSARLAQVLGAFWAGFSYQYLGPSFPLLGAGFFMFFAFLILLFLYFGKYKISD